MSDTLADVDAALAAESPTISQIAAGMTALSTLATQIATDVTALLASQGSGPDTTNEVTAIQADTAQLATAAAQMTAIAATLTAADQAANPPAGSNVKKS